MRTTTLLSVILMLLIPSCGNSPEITIQLINPSDQRWTDAHLLLTRDDISTLLEIPANKLPVLTDLNGDYIPCQLDDLNGDGLWDELFGLYLIEASAQSSVVISFVEEDLYPNFPIRTNLHLGDVKNGYRHLNQARRLEGVSYHNYTGRTSEAFQMEGPVWENDKVGFRNYLDQRNGIDIFGKISPEMVLDGVGVEGAPSYHEPGDWGMDVLKVGTSLGAGAIAYLYQDSLYRVGDNGTGSYEVVFEGSLRSRFKLRYENWKVDGLSLDVTDQIDIEAGRHYYEGTVMYEGTDESLPLVPGIVNMKSKQAYLWKLDEQLSILLTHDKQSEDGSYLAMGIMVPTESLISIGETRDLGEGITQTYYAAIKATPGETVSYRFYALWEGEDPRWASLEEIQKYLKIEAERWSSSVVYKVP